MGVDDGPLSLMPRGLQRQDLQVEMQAAGEDQGRGQRAGQGPAHLPTQKGSPRVEEDADG